jgi:hypothetical protein
VFCKNQPVPSAEKSKLIFGRIGQILLNGRLADPGVALSALGKTVEIGQGWLQSVQQTLIQCEKGDVCGKTYQTKN